MKNLTTFEHFKNPYIDKKAIANTPPKNIGYLHPEIEIRVDIEKIQHAKERQFRHVGSGSESITNDDIVETIELALEEITIGLMQDQFDIYQNEDDYPTKGVKAGQPNRFVIKNKTNNLNIVCQLEPGDNNFTLTVITVMVEPDFRSFKGQYIVTVRS